eukprot:TRINITY_DN67542_c8_g1_i1.p1 TRINITY_DN67542_c8_g1~~TRINITY_DN67542_c8_g1_i1.p1  ORF type:complete len:117 (-),score=12.51 TRINITY_DN67542_c8_g1_i1:377-727(-)
MTVRRVLLNMGYALGLGFYSPLAAEFAAVTYAQKQGWNGQDGDAMQVLSFLPFITCPANGIFCGTLSLALCLQRKFRPWVWVTVANTATSAYIAHSTMELLKKDSSPVQQLAQEAA